ncbi:3-dehydroquinate synthase [Luoshenia tenuis]|jgi:3-dehydroquinate synthase|uniref:3-dehydroquinate synthase n=1 Tax=Luoshenia tenuis TaxID=2763654 RepID=UPI003D8F338E
MRRVLNVQLKERGYPLVIEEGLLDKIGEEVRAVYPAERAFILTDRNVDAQYGAKVESALRSAGYQAAKMVLEPGEATKAFPSLVPIYSALLENKMTRTDLMITLGGGVVGDLGGFAASTYLRGIPFIQIPTSLLAQVDSSIGGKVAVDLPQGKNLVGSFYQPKAVFIDPVVLDTLPERYFKDGMAEVIKYGCICDRAFFDKLATSPTRAQLSAWMDELIYRCCDIKRQVVEADERDMGGRMVLNFGHTLGHAIEKYYHFGKYSHGEAVALGMVAITHLSEARGLTPAGTAQCIADTLKAHGLPYDDPLPPMAQLLEAIAHDKKNLGARLKLILLRQIGTCFIADETAAFFETNDVDGIE